MTNASLAGADAARLVCDRLEALFAAHRFHFTHERMLQDGIAQMMRENKLDFVREARLDALGTIDFLVQSRVGLEVKVQPALAETTRQLHRYAQHPTIEALVLVTSRLRRVPLPPTLNGKPLRVVRLVASAL